MAEIGEGNDGAAPDAHQLRQHIRRPLHRLQRVRKDHHVECGIGIIGQIGIGIALHDGKATAHGSGHVAGIQFDATAFHALGVAQPGQQLAIAATDIEHARACRHGSGHGSQIRAQRDWSHFWPVMR